MILRKKDPRRIHETEANVYNRSLRTYSCKSQSRNYRNVKKFCSTVHRITNTRKTQEHQYKIRFGSPSPNATMPSFCYVGYFCVTKVEYVCLVWDWKKRNRFNLWWVPAMLVWRVTVILIDSSINSPPI